MREIAARIGSFKALPAFRISRLCPEGSIDRRPLQQPVGLLLDRGRSFDVLPRHMIHRGSARRFHSSLDVAQDRQKISVAHEFDGAFGCTANCVFVDRTDRRATVRLTNDARVHHAVNLHVVNENAVPENLRGEVEAGAARANGLEIADGLSRGGAGCLDCKIDRAGKRPVVLSGRFAVVIDAAVANGEFAGLAGQHFRRLIEKQRANFGERLPQRHTTKLHRLAAGGVALVRGFFRVT